MQCHDCGVVGQIKVGFANVRRSYAKDWAKYALQLTRSMTIKDVADLLGVTWDVIKEIKKDDLRRRFANPSLKDVRRIVIDEICIGNRLTGWIKDRLNRTMIAAPPVVGKIAISNDDC